LYKICQDLDNSHKKRRERKGKERDRVKKAKKRQNEESWNIERKRNAAAMKGRRGI
jgi:hypothetical protein